MKNLGIRKHQDQDLDSTILECDKQRKDDLGKDFAYIDWEFVYLSKKWAFPKDMGRQEDQEEENHKKKRVWQWRLEEWIQIKIQGNQIQLRFP